MKAPTRITDKVRSTIDLIFSNMKCVVSSGVLCNEISDHLSNSLIKKNEREVKSFSTTTGRCMKMYDKVLFQSMLSPMFLGKC